MKTLHSLYHESSIGSKTVKWFAQSASNEESKNAAYFLESIGEGWLDDEPFEAEIRLVNEEGFTRLFLRKPLATQQGLISLVKAFEEGRRLVG